MKTNTQTLHKHQIPGGSPRIAILPILILLLFGNSVNLQSQAINSRGFYPGDWVSYTNNRFVRSISVGFFNVYFGTTQGVLRYDMETHEWLDPLTLSDGLPNQNIQTIAADFDDSRIWVLTSTGIYLYESVFGEWSEVNEFPDDKRLDNIAGSKSFQQYIPPFGLHITSTNVLEDSDFREFPIISAVESNQGDIWFGTWGMGAGTIENYDNRINLLPYGLYNEDVRAIYKDGERFFFGGRSDYSTDNAITIWDQSTDDWQYVEARYSDRVISDQVNDIEAVGKYIFLATDYGLVRMEKDGQSQKSYYGPSYFHTDILLSLEHHDDKLYIGSEEGMYSMDVGKDSISYMASTLMNTTAVFDILYYKGDLWIGSEIGAIRFDFETERFYRYSSQGGVLLALMMDVEQDTKDGIWFAGEDAIVWMDDRFEEQERFYINGDLYSHKPNKILVDERFLWVGTDYGLYRYDRMKNDWRDYTLEDGLIDERIYDLVLDGDYLWIGTEKGVTRFKWKNPARGVNY